MNKKASLSMAIEVIVIVVIAMTLLGLGLAFVKSQFGQITTIGTEVQQQVREQITGQLRASGEKVAFPRDITFNRRESKVITLGIQNVGQSALFYRLNLTWDMGNSDFGDLGIDPEDFGLRYEKECLQLLPAEADVLGIRASAVRTPGTFALRATIEQYANETCSGTPSTYATKLTYITVG
jgi:hypothetical protein